jgi:hypothetical protein
MKPKKIKVTDAETIFQNGLDQVKKSKAEFKANGGMCLNCGLAPGDPNGRLPFQCKKCNDKVEDLLKQLRGPGFMELKL